MEAPNRARRGMAGLSLGLALAVVVAEVFLLTGAAQLVVGADVDGAPTHPTVAVGGRREADPTARPTAAPTARPAARATAPPAAAATARPAAPPAAHQPDPTPIGKHGAASATPSPEGLPPGTQPTSERTRPAAEVPPAPLGTLLPTPAAAPPAVPPGKGGSCPYLDRLTPHRSYDDWARTLLDTEYRLPSSYAPRDLVDTSAAGLNRGYRIRRLVLDDLAAMATAAREAGVPFVVVSGYRSFATQQATFRYWVERDGLDYALRTSARPGHSEHQLGTAIDVTGRGHRDPWTYADWGQTPAGAWIGANSWRFGFVVTYPRGASARTCYDYEPWHLRYFGRDVAREMIARGLTAREYLRTRQ